MDTFTSPFRAPAPVVDQGPADEQPKEEEFWMTAYLPAGSSVIAKLREPIMVFDGPLNKINVSLLNGQLGIFGPFNEADAHATYGAIYVQEARVAVF